jgi:hypothetical protein
MRRASPNATAMGVVLADEARALNDKLRETHQRLASAAEGRARQQYRLSEKKEGRASELALLRAVKWASRAEYHRQAAEEFTPEKAEARIRKMRKAVLSQ